MNKKVKIEYIIYKTTCLIDGTYYIGSHFGSNVKKDDYLGSGRLIRAKIKSRGRENFRREILKECFSESEMKASEVEFIEKHIKDDKNLNLSRLSGGGNLGEFKYKPIIQFNEAGEAIKEWSSILELVKIMPVASKGRINSKYIANETDFKKLNCFGFVWIYKHHLDKINQERLKESFDSIKGFTFDKSIKNRPYASILMDVHIGNKNYSLIEGLFDQIIEKNKKNKVRLIIQCGDIFNSREGQPLECLLAFKRILLKLEENSMFMICIPGNHDKTDLNSELSFLSVFNFHESLLVLEKETVLDWIHPLYNFCFIPYFKEGGEFEKRLENLKKSVKNDKKSLLFTHIATNGVKNNDGSEVKNDLTSNKFSFFERVFVAHYHNKSFVKPNIHYLGSMYQANFGEDEEKGFCFLTMSGEIKRVKLDFPKFNKFSVDAKSITAKDIKDLQKMKEENPQDNIRIVLTGSEAEVNSFDKSLLESVGISVEKKPIDVEALEPEAEIELVSYNRDNITEAFNEFCDSKQITERTYGLELLNKL